MRNVAYVSLVVAVLALRVSPAHASWDASGNPVVTQSSLRFVDRNRDASRFPALEVAPVGLYGLRLRRQGRIAMGRIAVVR